MEFSGKMTFANLKAIKTNYGRQMLTTNYRNDTSVRQWDLKDVMEICPGLSSPRVIEFLDVNPDVPAYLSGDYDSDEEQEGHLSEGEWVGGEVGGEWKRREATKEDWIDQLANFGDIVTKANAEFGVDVS
eukprot:SAG22_NODE_4958_length_1122_cov_7.331378_2_plen_129_part_01